MRPATLSEAAQRILAGVPVSKAIPEFLDTFYFSTDANERMAMFATEPPPTGCARTDALMGAICEYLSKRYGLLTVAPWASAPCRCLPSPWFTMPPGNNNAGMQEFLAFSSPAEFRSRNIFTEAEPLRRASQRCGKPSERAANAL